MTYTYREAMTAIELRTEELLGIGRHGSELGAKLATGEALDTLEALENAVRAARKMLREERGYEHYLTE
jgi:hypothetical protein